MTMLTLSSETMAIRVSLSAMLNVPLSSASLVKGRSDSAYVVSLDRACAALICDVARVRLCKRGRIDRCRR